MNMLTCLTSGLSNHLVCIGTPKLMNIEKHDEEHYYSHDWKNATHFSHYSNGNNTHKFTPYMYVS